jgi:hypothetical protein
VAHTVRVEALDEVLADGRGSFQYSVFSIQSGSAANGIIALVQAELN